MTQVENEVRQQLAQALIARAEADEKIVQLRAMLQAATAIAAEREKEESAKVPDAAT